MTKAPNALAIVRAEQADFEQRREAAQRNADNAQRAMNAAQATFQNASREVLMYEAASQACTALLMKLTPPVEPKERKPRAKATPPAKP